VRSHWTSAFIGQTSDANCIIPQCITYRLPWRLIMISIARATWQLMSLPIFTLDQVLHRSKFKLMKNFVKQKDMNCFKKIIGLWYKSAEIWVQNCTMNLNSLKPIYWTELWKSRSIIWCPPNQYSITKVWTQSNHTVTTGGGQCATNLNVKLYRLYHSLTIVSLASSIEVINSPKVFSDLPEKLPKYLPVQSHM